MRPCILKADTTSFFNLAAAIFLISRENDLVLDIAQLGKCSFLGRGAMVKACKQTGVIWKGVAVSSPIMQFTYQNEAAFFSESGILNQSQTEQW